MGSLVRRRFGPLVVGRRADRRLADGDLYLPRRLCRVLRSRQARTHRPDGLAHRHPAGRALDPRPGWRLRRNPALSRQRARLLPADAICAAGPARHGLPRDRASSSCFPQSPPWSPYSASASPISRSDVGPPSWKRWYGRRRALRCNTSGKPTGDSTGCMTGRWSARFSGLPGSTRAMSSISFYSGLAALSRADLPATQRIRDRSRTPVRGGDHGGLHYPHRDPGVRMILLWLILTPLIGGRARGVQRASQQCFAALAVARLSGDRSRAGPGRCGRHITALRSPSTGHGSLRSIGLGSRNSASGFISAWMASACC